VREHGERAVISNWKSAKRSRDGALVGHIIRYEWALDKLQGSQCLDAGCGSGYGTHFLANNGVDEIIGVDASEVAIRYCLKCWSDTSNVAYRVMDVRRLDFDDESFSALVSFEVLEHLDDQGQEQFISEVARVLRPGGIALISCPNEFRSVHRNPFHLKELSCDELSSLLGRHFGEVTMYGQELVANEPSNRYSRLARRIWLPRVKFEISDETRETALWLVALTRKS